MSKKSIAARSIIFLLILTFALKIFSSLSIAMGYNANPLFNYSGYSIFQEPDNSVDVLAIGDSNVYSGIFLSYGGNRTDSLDIPGDRQASVFLRLMNI